MNFDKAFHIVVGIEGNFQNDPDDNGNWTGGRKGVGKLVGTKYGISAACVAPETRVLTSDLQWLPIGTLSVGDELIGFAPGKHGMVLQPSVILEIGPLTLPSCRVVTDRGTVIASHEHMWWCTKKANRGLDYRWALTTELKPGYGISFYKEPWNEDMSPDAQWLAGILDGEGSIKDGYLSVFQNEGVVLERIRRILNDKGISFVETLRRNNVAIRLNGKEAGLALVGSIRPTRMLDKSRKSWNGKGTFGRYSHRAIVQEVIPIGDHPVTGIRTSTGTLITEGLLSHNSYPKLNIPGITLDQAKDIYRQNYWNRICGDVLSWQIALPLFDAAINEGVTQSVRQLQAAAHVQCDGIVGAKTLTALNAMNQDELLREFMVIQLFYKIDLGRPWKKYGLGWARRLLTITIHAVRGE